MKFKTKDISKEAEAHYGRVDEIDWKELWSDGYDAVIIDDVAFSFSRFGLEGPVDMASTIM